MFYTSLIPEGIRESQPQFENRIMARVYVRSITRSTMYQKLHFVSRNWRMENSSVACGFSSIKIDYSDHPRSLISRTNEVCVVVFSIKYRYSNILLKKHKLHLGRMFCSNHTCHCVNMVSVTSASRYITSASRYHPRYQSRSSMYIRGLIPRNSRNWPRQFRLPWR